MNCTRTGSETGKQIAQKWLLSSLTTCGINTHLGNLPHWHQGFSASSQSPNAPPKAAIKCLLGRLRGMQDSSCIGLSFPSWTPHHFAGGERGGAHPPLWD